MAACLVLRGYAFRLVGRTRTWGIDWRKCIESHRKYLIDPLRERYGRCDLILATYDSERLPLDELKRDYLPDVLVHFPEGRSQRQTAVVALQQVLEVQAALGVYDQVVMTRFDVELLRCPLDLPNYDPQKVNFLWREWNEVSWKDHKRVPDAIHMLPGTLVEGFLRGLGEAPSDSCLHLVYYPVSRHLGEERLNVMSQEGFHNSNTDTEPNGIYKLVRIMG